MRANDNIDPNTETIKQQSIPENLENQSTIDTSTNKIADENLNGKDKFDQQYEIFRNQMKPFKKFEFLFLLFLFGVIGYVWIYIYKRPVPKIISRVLGIDDTLYPEQLEKMKIND